jgi:glycine betaine catabolism B
MPEVLANTSNRFLPVASIGDVPPGWVLKAKVRGREMALANCGGAIHAVDSVCTHACGPLGNSRLLKNGALECPWHNSLFDARTGEVIKGPARKALKSYEVRVENGDILVALD